MRILIKEYESIYKRLKRLDFPNSEFDLNINLQSL